MAQGALERVLAHVKFALDDLRAHLLSEGQNAVILVDNRENGLGVDVHLVLPALAKA